DRRRAGDHAGTEAMGAAASGTRAGDGRLRTQQPPQRAHHDRDDGAFRGADRRALPVARRGAVPGALVGRRHRRLHGHREMAPVVGHPRRRRHRAGPGVRGVVVAGPTRGGATPRGTQPRRPLCHRRLHRCRGRGHAGAAHDPPRRTHRPIRAPRDGHREHVGAVPVGAFAGVLRFDLRGAGVPRDMAQGGDPVSVHPVAFAPAALFAVLFVISFLRDRRRLRNGVFLVLTLAFLAMALALVIGTASERTAGILFAIAVLMMPLAVLALGVFLILSGVTMLRREGRRLANMLALLSGIGIVAYVPAQIVVGLIDWTPLTVTASAINGVLFYISFLFVCFLVYSVVYGRIRSRRAVDFVVVLGAGLLDGTRVPPLLASRLDRGREVFDAQRTEGRDPMLVTSGGQGADEDLPEAHAMRDYLVDRGVPADRVLVEDRSRTTWENL